MRDDTQKNSTHAQPPISPEAIYAELRKREQPKQEAHAYTRILIEEIHNLTNAGHVKVVKGGNGFQITNVLVDETGKEQLTSLGIEVTKDDKLVAAHKFATTYRKEKPPEYIYQVAVGPLDKPCSLIGKLINRTNFEVAFEPALIRQAKQEEMDNELPQPPETTAKPAGKKEWRERTVQEPSQATGRFSI